MTCIHNEQRRAVRKRTRLPIASWPNQPGIPKSRINGCSSWDKTTTLVPVVFILWCGVAGLCFPGDCGANDDRPSNQRLWIATFQCDATPPVGSVLCHGNVPPAEKIVDPLTARGIILLANEQPILLCAVDWVGISNAAHDLWRETLARAVGTTMDRVSVHALHQHDAPGVDFTAGSLLANCGLGGKMYHEAFSQKAIDRAAEAAATALHQPQQITHLGFGSGKVEQFASNRRILGPDGKVRAVRYTTCKDPSLRAEPEGTIDPFVKSISFWNGNRPVAVLTYYATHPQSYYGRGGISADTVGLARGIREAKVPNVAHLHFNGAGGNVGAGKYNDGSTENRSALANRLAVGMKMAWKATKKVPVSTSDVEWNTVAVSLPLRESLDEHSLLKILHDDQATERDRLFAARDLAWMRRVNHGHKLTIGCLRIGTVRALHLPGELFVEYQLAAQQMLPDGFVCMAAYGDLGPGYIGTRVAYSQGGYETSRVSRTSPNVERILMAAIRSLLKK